MLHVAKRIDAAFPGNKIQFTREVFASIESSIPGLNIFMRVLVGLAAVISALVVMLAMHTTITERTREIGLLKALGFQTELILKLLLGESVLLSFSGAMIGTLGARAAYSNLNLAVITSGFVQNLHVGGKIIGMGAVIGVTVGIFAAAMPAWTASHRPAVEALRRVKAHFRNGIVTGVGGKQIIVDDPSGNPIELFEPTIPEARLGSRM